MKRNQMSKIPFKDESHSIVSEVKSKHVPSDYLSKENESYHKQQVHASKDHLANMQFKHPSKLPKVVSAKKDFIVGNVPEICFDSRRKGISNHDTPYDIVHSRFDDQNDYSSGNGSRVDVPHRKTKENDREERNRTGSPYHGKPYYEENLRSEDQDYYPAGYGYKVDVSHGRPIETKKGARSHTENSYPGKPYYDETIRSEDQDYYPADYGSKDVSHRRPIETERGERSHTESSYRGKPYYEESLRSEDQNYYPAGYGSKDVSHKRPIETKRGERSHTESSYRGKPYYEESLKPEDQYYYPAGDGSKGDTSHKMIKKTNRGGKSDLGSYYYDRPYYNANLQSEVEDNHFAGYDDRLNISQKGSKKAERDERSNAGFSYNGRSHYNEAVSIEDENYLYIGHGNQVDVPQEETKEKKNRRNHSKIVKEIPSHSIMRFDSNINTDIHLVSGTVLGTDHDQTQKANKMCYAEYERHAEHGAIPKQLFWSRGNRYDNKTLSIEDENRYDIDNPKNRHDAVSSFQNEPEYKKEKDKMISRTHYHTNHSYDDSSTQERMIHSITHSHTTHSNDGPPAQEMNYNASLKNKFQNDSKLRNNAVLPNQIFEEEQTDNSHTKIVSNNSFQKDYFEKQYEHHDQVRSSAEIRKRHVTANDDYDDFQHIDDKNFHRNTNAQTISNQKPLTINDAYTVAEAMLGPSKQITSFTINEQNSNNVITEIEEMKGRKCWSKMCFSVSWHSHAITRSFLGTSVVNREAILDTLPLGRQKRKSCWSQCLDIFGCFKNASAALELWNNSLKRIEGLQGTGVVSYFVFLRWLIALNLIMFLLYFLLITLPHAAFPILPLKDISVAPNESAITEEFVNKYDNLRPKEFKPKEMKNSSLPLHQDNLFSNWGILLENLPENILDLTLAYSKKNHTSAERRNNSLYCEAQYRAEMANSTGGILSAMQDLLQGTGWLQSTILFLGHYPANEISYFGLVYNMPIAVIAVLFVSFVICLCMMIQYSSHGVQETILARKNDYLQYSNILFCSWDYCIEDRKSSVVRHNSILQEIKSTLAEEHRKREIKQWSRSKKIKVYFLRTLINLFVIAALISSYYLIYRVVNYQLEEIQLHRLSKPGVNTLFVQYLSPIVITGLNIIVPIIFNNIVKFEMYKTQTQINMALFRTVFLRLSSVFVLVGLLYQQITCEPRDMCGAGITETCLSPICWETYVGQQLYKLAVTDFFVYVMMFILYDVPRDVIVRHCKNKVTQMIGRQVFDLPNQVLSLVYSQTLCWLGVVYSPLLPAITVIKFVIIFYIKKKMVLKYCVPAPIPYKASRSNAMFMIILMLSFFTLMIIHGYSLSNVEPSPACSPFRHYSVMTEALSDSVLKHSSTFASIFNFFFSALFLIPAIILLCIAIYYYWTIVVAHRKMVKVLKAQIAIEGHDKQFLLNRLTEVAKGQFYK